MTTATPAPIRSHIEPRLTFRRLARITAPLVLTFLMMSGAAPVVTGGIAWTYGPEGERVHLAAFLLMFTTALLVYSPAFVARNIAIRMVVDRRSLVRFLVANFTWAIASAALLVGLSRSHALGGFVFGTIFGGSPEIVALARQGIILFAPVPFLVILRGLGQGCHINNGDTWYVGIGTTIRLVAMALFVFGYAVRVPRSGPVLGGQTFLLGIGVETAYVLWMLRGRPQWRVDSSRPIISYRQFVWYAVPLMLAATMTRFVTPLLIHLINMARLPSESLAGYDLLRSSIWFMLSVLYCVQPVILAHADSRANFHAMIRFSGVVLAAATSLVAAIAFTPLRHIVYEGLLQVDNRIIAGLLYTALEWVVVLPLLLLTNQIAQGLHTRSGRTRWVTAGTACGLLLLVTLNGAMSLGWLDASRWDGTLLAVVALIGFHSIAVAVQLVGLLGDGLAASLSKRELSEQMAADAIR